jgi:hypothetical protein
MVLGPKHVVAVTTEEKEDSYLIIYTQQDANHHRTTICVAFQNSVPAAQEAYCFSITKISSPMFLEE